MCVYIYICLYKYSCVLRRITIHLSQECPEWRWSCGLRARRHLRVRPLDGSRRKKK